MFDGSSARYLGVALSALDAIESALVRVSEPRTILDLPCGHGRVTRILRARYPRARIVACDLDRHGVEFCARTFAASGVVSVLDFAALALDGTFDLIWVGSLLTHLPERATRRFLGFACRHMGPDSRLVLTSHGESTVRRLRADTYRLGTAASRGLAGQFLSAGYGYRGYGGNPDYGVSAIDLRWFETVLAGSPLRLESHHPEGWDDHQDVLVLRRAAGEAARGFEDGPVRDPLPEMLQAAADATSFPGFDEAWYRAAYPDVARAIEDGACASGLAHFLAHGWAEARHGADPAQAYARRTPARDDAWSAGRADASPQVGGFRSSLPASGRAATGEAGVDLYAWLGRFIEARGALPVAHAVSIGCGSGALERAVASKGLALEIDAFDADPGAVVRARRDAERLGLVSARYRLADLGHLVLPEGSFDLAFAHPPIDQVGRLGPLLDTIARALRPGGMLQLCVDVGPAPTRSTGARPGRVDASADGGPARDRDRSAGLVALLEARFDVVERRSAGEDATARGVPGRAFEVLLARLKPSHAPRSNGSMKPSLAARAASVLPPLRRLHEGVRSLAASVTELQAAYERTGPAIEQVRSEMIGLLSGSMMALRERQDRVESALADRTPAAPPAPLAAPTASEPADMAAILDRATLREMGEAARRNLPFLPGNFEIADDCITVSGFCGAPDGLTGGMAFFVNGERIADVDYPIEDAELKSRFPDVPGMGLMFRARIRENLEARRGERFWRFDASPTGRYNAADWRRASHFMNPAMERFGFPPEANIRRVIGDTSIERFAMGGAMIFHNAGHYLRELGRDWSDFPEILDWGCGAGRLTRYLISETSSKVTGVDIDPDNIGFCQRTYDGGTFHTVPLRPPTGLEADRYDLVFGLSVMTHLQEQDQFLWLEELRRITRPGALLFLSIQGPTQFSYNKFPPALFRKIEELGYLNLQRDDALADVIEDKEYYRSAMQSRAYVVARWGEYFEPVAIVDAIAALQDFVVLRRR